MYKIAFLLSILPPFLASCDIASKQFDCEANSKLELSGEYAIDGSAEFKSYGVDGLGIINFDGCALNPEIREIVLPDGEFDQSILALNGQAWNENKSILAEIEGTITCVPDRGCTARLSKTGDMKIQD